MGNHKIGIITDSTSDIPAELAEQLGIIIVPQVIVWSGETYKDRIDMQPEEFYQRLATDPVMPTTSQASTQDFAEYYELARQQGAEELVVLTLSSALSGTYQSAQNAAELCPIPVHLWDTKNATMGEGWQVVAAARARAQGADVQGILAAADFVRSRIAVYVYLDTIEYLHRGGRIGNAVNFIGMMLNIKPLVLVSSKSGIVEPIGIARTSSKGVDQVYRKFFEAVDPSRPMHITVLHGHAPVEAEKLAERVRKEYPSAELYFSVTCPVIGVHTGPGALGLCGYSE